ncbi:MAG: FHA domain-containing protein [Thermodesulfobacteriota bacterium]
MGFSLCILAGKGEGGSFKLVPETEYLVGRHSENNIVISDHNVSRRHLKVQVKGERYFITDLHSKNGTFVGGQDIKPGTPTEVNEGVPIVIGTTVLGFGEICRTCLKPFLDSDVFFSEGGKRRGGIEWNKVMSLKKSLGVVHNLNKTLMEARDLKELSGNLLDTIFYFFKGIDRCVILSIDDETREIRNTFYRSRRPVDDPQKLYSREMVEHVLTTKKPVLFDAYGDVEAGEDQLTESLRMKKIGSAMCVPIMGSYGVRGVIYLDFLERPNGLKTESLALLMDISGRAAPALDNVILRSWNVNES